MSKYFYTNGEAKFGPFSKDELKIQNISRKTKVWCYGMDNWRELPQIAELDDVLNSIPPELDSKPSEVKVSGSTMTEADSALDPRTIASSSIGKRKSKTIAAWLITIVIMSLVSLRVYSLIKSKSEANKYNEIVSNSYSSDEDFDMYVQKFYRDIELYGIFPKKPKVQIIKFSKLDQLDNTTDINGISFGINNDDRIEIYINPSTWAKFNKPMRYFLMYHELAHDVLNLNDLEAQPWNEGKLMYPAISSYENKNMDDFIESAHALFERQQRNNK